MKRIVAALAFVLVALPVAANVIRIDQYLAALERLHGLLATNQLATAQEEARKLSEYDVGSAQGTFHADTSLLDEIANAKRVDVQVQSRLAVTIEEVRRAAGVGGATPADPKLLQRVAREQQVPELVPGGDLSIDAKPTPLVERIAKGLADAWNWVIDKLNKLLDWIFGFFPDSMRPGATGGMRWIVGALVLLIVLLIVFLALEVRRRARRKASAAIETSAPLGSKRDEDPLSRGASEWERYAAQLEDAGRFREAIRAWYHAVLVTCYSAGVLHFRKSRTNWEYISAIAPVFAWRSEFIMLTQRFEREWYGSNQSTIDALDDCRDRARTIIESVRTRGAA